MVKTDRHIFQGLKRDNYPIRQPGEYLWSAHNIRLISRNDNTTLSITNEKSTDFLYSFDDDEYYVGHSTVGKWLVLFTRKDDEGVISRIDMDMLPKVKRQILIRDSSLDFSEDYPIQALSSFESELIQKVYWVDSKHNPRLINVAKPELLYTKEELDTYNDDFSNESSTGLKRIYEPNTVDFAPKLSLQENIEVEEVGGAGMFPAGVLQYALTYIDKYGQESNIFYTSRLFYTHNTDRAGSPEDNIATAFKITVGYDHRFPEEGIEKGFTHIRIYSIMRTSYSLPPTIKVVSEMEITKDVCSYIDNNTEGYTVDKDVLLYIGGKDLIAETLDNKDNVLFMGNITLNGKNPYSIKINDIPLKEYMMSLKNDVVDGTRTVSLDSNPCFNRNQLSDNTSTFKTDDWYRLGIQFQYKTGEWSDPVFICDRKYGIKRGENENSPLFYNTEIVLPVFKLYLEKHKEMVKTLIKEGYYKVRPVVVFPDITDRRVLCQGILNPTVFNDECRKNNAPYSQASWLFRPMFNTKEALDTAYKRKAPYLGLIGQSTSKDKENAEIFPYNHRNADGKGVKGIFNIDYSVLTFNSPDIEFDEGLQRYITPDRKFNVELVGLVNINQTYSAVKLTQTTSNYSPYMPEGFQNPGDEIYQGSNSYISGKWFKDVMIRYNAVDHSHIPIKDDIYYNKEITDRRRTLKYHDFTVYMWQPSGSLNNDVNSDEGLVRTAMLGTKIISNLKYSTNTTWLKERIPFNIDSSTPQVFNSNEESLLKFNSNKNNYYGNVDYMWITERYYKAEDLGIEALDKIIAPVSVFDSVRMKYKSTPHLLVAGEELPVLSHYTENKVTKIDIRNYLFDNDKRLITGNKNEAKKDELVLGLWKPDVLWLAEITQEVNEKYLFGGTTEEALRSNIWIPAGYAFDLRHNNFIEWIWGDTWYQRYDCLKTYPYTEEDPNQIVEICSFMVESRVNLDGRYDRNRGNVNNLSVRPTNFNLINKVYSQHNDFFAYKIFDSNFYKVKAFHNQVIWSKAKTPAAIVDEWTSISQANSIDLNGNLGNINAVKTVGETVLAFQDKGISQIMYNSRVQIQPTDGVPIEIGNSGRVDGARVLSDSIGCQNKFSIVSSSGGVYFADANTSSLYRFGDNQTNLSDVKGTKFWSSNDIMWRKWTLNPLNRNNGIRTYLNPYEGDIYFTVGDADSNIKTLGFSEKLDSFTSTFDYNGSVMIPYKNNLYAIAHDNIAVNGLKHLALWEVTPKNSISYNKIFNRYRGFNIGYVCNDNPDFYKIFDTVDIEADSFDGDILLNDWHKYSPVSYIEAQNEYQHGKIDFDEYPRHMRKRFRIWRAMMPRNDNSRQRISNLWTIINIGKDEKYIEKYKDENLTLIHTVMTNYNI